MIFICYIYPKKFKGGWVEEDVREQVVSESACIECFYVEMLISSDFGYIKLFNLGRVPHVEIFLVQLKYWTEPI